MDIPSGLTVHPNIISPENEQILLSWIDSQTWSRVTPSNPYSRRVQHYGYDYSYRSGGLTPTTPISGPLLGLVDHFDRAGLMKPVQCIINEYYQTQGISSHTDNKNFGPTIIGVSIGADAVMTFRRGTERYDCFLPRRSVLIMTGEARYLWTHEISSNKSYMLGDQRIMKPDDYRRISLTFRELAN